MKEVIVKRYKYCYHFILIIFKTSTEILILCAGDKLYVLKLDFSGAQGSGFIQ
jgi:hypothetical protein